MLFLTSFRIFWLSLYRCQIAFIIFGDFNIPFGNGSSDAVAMNNILDMFNLKQHVNFPTHTFGNTLDWLITSDECNLINKIRSINQMGDHSSFIATLNETAKLCQPKEKINDRSYRKFDIENFKNALTNSDLIQNPDTNSATSLYTQYHDTSMSTLLDKHAPLKSYKVTPNAIPVNERITGEILLSKRKKKVGKNMGKGSNRF